MRPWWPALFALSLASGAHAQGDDALTWLGRMAEAGQRQSYVGTFTYQNGTRSETSRIAHVLEAAGEMERLETLDGSLREVTRKNNEVRCVLPAQKTIIVDQASSRRGFPSRLAEAWMNLGESYRIHRGAADRVAGLDAQQVILEPKDDLRYGYRLLADVKTGLLLKSRMVDERGDTVEQFSFNEVRIGVPVERKLLQSTYPADADGWRVVNTRGEAVGGDRPEWGLKAGIPGFRATSTVKRHLGELNHDAVHLVYSDGLAAVSIFIEPLEADAAPAEPGEGRSGSVNIYKRVLGTYRITALGEVPAATVRRFAEAVERLPR
jgi:sigma-E factor negative regulatory protein RseB